MIPASSLAVFGDAPGLMLPAAIEDHTLPTPQSSYGIQKFIGERPRSKNLKKPPGWRALAFKRLSR